MINLGDMVKHACFKGLLKAVDMFVEHLFGSVLCSRKKHFSIKEPCSEKLFHDVSDLTDGVNLQIITHSDPFLVPDL